MYKKEQPISPIKRANVASTILIPVRSKMRNRKTSLAVIKIATHKVMLILDFILNQSISFSSLNS